MNSTICSELCLRARTPANKHNSEQIGWRTSLRSVALLSLSVSQLHDSLPESLGWEVVGDPSTQITTVIRVGVIPVDLLEAGVRQGCDIPWQIGAILNFRWGWRLSLLHGSAVCLRGLAVGIVAPSHHPLQP